MLVKVRKYKLKIVLSAHNFKQIKELDSNLESAGASIILPRGTSKDNFKDFEAEFKHQGFELDDMLNLKEFETLNLVSVSGKKTTTAKKAFISKLPAPVPGKIEMREDISLQEFKDRISERIALAEAQQLRNALTEEAIRLDELEAMNNAENNDSHIMKDDNYNNLLNIEEKLDFTNDTSNIQLSFENENILIEKTNENYTNTNIDNNDIQTSNMLDTPLLTNLNCRKPKENISTHNISSFADMIKEYERCQKNESVNHNKDCNEEIDDEVVLDEDTLEINYNEDIDNEINNTNNQEDIKDDEEEISEKSQDYQHFMGYDEDNEDSDFDF
jgi:hypothetical protein